MTGCSTRTVCGQELVRMPLKFPVISQQILHDVLIEVAIHLGVHVSQDGFSRSVDIIVWTTTSQDDLAMRRWWDVLVLVVAQPVVAKVAGRLAATYIIVAICKGHGHPTELICHLKLSMRACDDGLGETTSKISGRRVVQVHNFV